MFFLPQNTLKRAQAMKMLEIIVAKNGMEFLGWRTVPTHPEVLGEKARACMPCIRQCFVKRPETVKPGLDFDRKLYIVRREFEQSNNNSYIASFSSRTIVYKGMFLVGQLRKFYADLTAPDCESALALVHSRFSTNTNPSWERAHPNRYIMHNGEINTIRGNADRMLAREETMHSALLSDEDMDKVLPVVDQSGSDSAMLDNTLEFLMMNGIDLPQAVMMTIPEPWANDSRMSREKRDFYQYYATMMEAWDGPAAIVFSDGDSVGAVLDRNGLRPCRWYLTDDEYLILSSEVGVLDIPAEHIVKKSRLQPGKMLLVDLVKKRIVDDEAIKSRYASQSPYGEWLDGHLVKIEDLPIPNKKVEKHTQQQRDKLYKAFGYTYEEVKDAILPMAKNGAEPTSAMGVDIPLAVLSEAHQPLFNYFKQLFAQVTNPPIDAIREKIVTDTTVFVGSGPAGLAAADQLNHRGHSVTVIEKHEYAGGILMYGIPNMKLPKRVVQRRIDFMTDEGVSFVTGVDAARPEIAQRLLREYDAVLLCCGAEKPREIGVDHAGVKGVYYAMDFLHGAVERQQLGKEPAVPSAAGKAVVIIGTGNTASDCVATALRQGCRSVIQLVRRPMGDYLNPAGALPQDYAQQEAEAVFGEDPRRFSSSVAELISENGELTGIRTNAGETIPCDLLIGATGFAGCAEDVCTAFGVAMNRTVTTEPEHYQTNVEKVFTAGDMHRGQSLVVWAIAEGRAAAAEVDEYLMGYTNLR